ncbi:hypothetical protein [Nocardia vermiculata]|uniref:Uncharacterized protein n=1 Tax=Nocardia vermiculata TaxID=257274 RepID=A0A846Y1C5_9NOCA|nr:hypothetical protein [Nocardia vermiculata]NKY53276.1 hypothetical protein [Nocardia vermiculata]
MALNDFNEDPSPHTKAIVLDLVALSVIAATVVALVVAGAANAAVLIAAGGLITTCFRVWRAGHK